MKGHRLDAVTCFAFVDGNEDAGISLHKLILAVHGDSKFLQFLWV